MLTDNPSEGVFSRREVNRTLLAAALAVAGSGKVLARPAVLLFDFAIAGGYYHGLGPALQFIKPGMSLALVREADNPVDVHAVAVHFGAIKLGYIPKEANRPVASLLDQGEVVTADVLRMLDMSLAKDVPETLVFTSFTQGDPMIRLTLSSRD